MRPLGMSRSSPTVRRTRWSASWRPGNKSIRGRNRRASRTLDRSSHCRSGVRWRRSAPPSCRSCRALEPYRRSRRARRRCLPRRSPRCSRRHWRCRPRPGPMIRSVRNRRRPKSTTTRCCRPPRRNISKQRCVSSRAPFCAQSCSRRGRYGRERIWCRGRERRVGGASHQAASRDTDAPIRVRHGAAQLGRGVSLRNRVLHWARSLRDWAAWLVKLRSPLH